MATKQNSKRSAEDIENNTADQTVVVPKRQRGRPRKILRPEESQAASTEDPASDEEIPEMEEFQKTQDAILQKLEAMDKKNDQNHKSISADVRSIRSDVTSLSNRVSTLETSTIAHLKGEMKALKSELTSLADKIPNTEVANSVPDVSAQFRELRDRERRRNNIIVYGLNETGDATDTKLSDEQKIKKLLSSFQIACDKFSAYRLRTRNRISSRPCPIKIEFPDISTASQLISKFYASNSTTKTGDWMSVTVSRDLTKLQQEDRKLKQDELRQRRANGENVKMSLINGSHVITTTGTRQSGNGNGNLETE